MDEAVHSGADLSAGKQALIRHGFFAATITVPGIGEDSPD